MGAQKIKFFHSCANKRRRANTVKSLELVNGQLTLINHEIEAIATRFFENLFTSQKGVVKNEHILVGMFRCIFHEDNLILLASYISKKVVTTLKDIGSTKAPGMDSFLALFFRILAHYWFGCE